MVDLGQPLAVGRAGVDLHRDLVSRQNEVFGAHLLLLGNGNVGRQGREFFYLKQLGIHFEIAGFIELIRLESRVGLAAYLLTHVAFVSVLGFEVTGFLGLGLALGLGLVPVPVDTGGLIQDDTLFLECIRLDLLLVAVVLGLGLGVMVDTVLFHVLEATSRLDSGGLLARHLDELFCRVETQRKAHPVGQFANHVLEIAALTEGFDERLTDVVLGHLGW